MTEIKTTGSDDIPENEKETVRLRLRDTKGREEGPPKRRTDMVKEHSISRIGTTGTAVTGQKRIVKQNEKKGRETLPKK